MTVLAIDTAGPVIGVALALAGRVGRRIGREKRAEGVLLPWAAELCAERGIGLRDVGGVVVSVGPGAFTGVRVGLATALGLAVSLGVPVWGELSLASRGRRAASAASGAAVLAMLDARKGRVYAGIWRDSRWEIGPADVPPDVAVAWAAVAGAGATGEGALVYAERLAARGIPVHPDAADPAVDTLAEMGLEALALGRPGDPGDLSPVYLRDADALPSARRST